MTRLTTTLTVLADAAGFVLSSPAAHAQNGPPSGPHRIGLIDMAHIFKEYKWFTDQRAQLKVEIKNSDTRIKAMVADMKKLKAQYADKTIKDGSPQKKALLQQLISADTNYRTFRQSEQQRFLDKEAKIYKSVYMEVTKAVDIYATHFQYTLILRFSRANVADATESRAILTKLNRLVIYSKPGHDITTPILDHLNKQYVIRIGGGRARRPVN